jgi:hypothetical protein
VEKKIIFAGKWSKYDKISSVTCPQPVGPIHALKPYFCRAILKEF